MKETNEEWKRERKACSHMFYKERLREMLKAKKHHLYNSIRRWKEDMDKNGGETRVDISKAFEIVNADAINHICFGMSVENDTFDFLYMDEKTNTFSEKKVNIRQAIHNLSKQ